MFLFMEYIVEQKEWDRRFGLRIESQEVKFHKRFILANLILANSNKKNSLNPCSTEITINNKTILLN